MSSPTSSIAAASTSAGQFYYSGGSFEPLSIRKESSRRLFPGTDDVGPGTTTAETAPQSILSFSNTATGPLLGGSLYEFNVFVSNGFTQADASTQLQIISHAIPSISIEPTLTHYSPNSPILLTADINVDANSIINAAWVLPLNNSAMVATALTSEFKGGATATSLPFYLQLQPGALLPGRSYQFQVIATFAPSSSSQSTASGSAIATASVSIWVNLPPVGGKVSGVFHFRVAQATV